MTRTVEDWRAILKGKDDREVARIIAIHVLDGTSVEAAITALRSEEREANWRPIAIAPKDGTHILVCNPVRVDLPPTVVHWFVDGFYTSVNEIAPDRPFPWLFWQSLPPAPESHSHEFRG